MTKNLILFVKAILIILVTIGSNQVQAAPIAGNVNLFGDRGGDVDTMDDHFAMTVHGNSNHSGRDITDTEITNKITGAASDILMRP
jgi:hypothetical protein